MPLYEFACSVCGIRFDRLQDASFASPACPDCGSRTKRLISVIAGLGRSSSSSGSEPRATGGGCGCGGACACGRG